MTKTGSIAVQMGKILDQYDDEVKKTTDASIEKVSKEAVQKLKNTSPKGTPHRRRYAEGWRKKKVKGRNGIDPCRQDIRRDCGHQC